MKVLIIAYINSPKLLAQIAAKDILDFTIAILDFTYSFKDKFDKFKDRIAQKGTE